MKRKGEVLGRRYAHLVDRKCVYGGFERGTAVSHVMRTILRVFMCVCICRDKRYRTGGLGGWGRKRGSMRLPLKINMLFIHK